MITNLLSPNLFMTYLLVALFCFGIILVFTTRVKDQYNDKSDTDFSKVHTFLKRHGGNHLSHLILLKDKQVYWAKDDNVLIAYRKVGKMLMVLGDPIGKKEMFEPAIKEFLSSTKKLGLIPVFYQVSSDNLELYNKEGFRSFKVGEEGAVSLSKFTLKGKQGAKLRTRKNKFNRNGYEFKVNLPPHTKSFISEIESVSNSWLADRKEKGFSVASFSEEYLSHFPIATLKDTEGRIIAFGSLASNYQEQDSVVTIDLMRNISNSPHGTMDVLFIQIFEWAQEQGFGYCSLGMAPLSNVGVSKDTTLWEKFGRFVYKNGNSFYKFKGLKEFKSKFAHDWHSKYIVYKKAPLLFICIRLALIVHFRPSLNGKFKWSLNFLKRNSVNNSVKYK